MNCPPEIAPILLQIIQLGILAARIGGWEDNPERAVLEADHIHNLPALLLKFSPEMLNYYWEFARPSYIHRHRELGYKRTGFENLWEQLRLAVPTLKSDTEIDEEEKRANA